MWEIEREREREREREEERMWTWEKWIENIGTEKKLFVYRFPQRYIRQFYIM